MKLILINGESKSGKNTVAKMMYEKLSRIVGEERVLIIENANKVKELAIEFFNWNNIKDEKGKQLLIDITNTGYNYNPTFWEEKTLRSILYYTETISPLDYVIIPDWRYENTYNYFSQNPLIESVKTIRVERPNYDNGYSDKIKNDLSEIGLRNFNFDAYIINCGDLEELEEKVDIALDMIRGW
ncbi:MAG: hypothetical protein H0Z24_05830 [Thermosipho sp. (in: Bacteria)]|nr:hypothetical protein [Thermosipho sp. (in: thermotogales)]